MATCQNAPFPSVFTVQPIASKLEAASKSYGQSDQKTERGRRLITAAEALGYGLVNHMFPRKELRARVTELAAKISSKSPLSLKLLKRSMIHGGDMPMAAALQYEQAMIGLLLDSKDAHEGCRAFLEKRAPDFQGR